MSHNSGRNASEGGSSRTEPASPAPAGDDATTARRARMRPTTLSADTTPPPAHSRYSRFVSLMKFVLPVFALVLLAVVLIYSGLFDRRDELDITFREIETQPSELRMVSPRVAGVSSDGQPYVVTADNATQDPARPNFVVLENLNADIRLDEKQDWLSISAADGLYNSEAQTLDLGQRIDIFTSQGYEMHGTGATVDFDKGIIFSDKEVTGQGPLGTLRADTMRANHASQVLRFDGNVKMLIHPDQPRGDE